MAKLSFSSICQQCGKAAPIVLRGLQGRCAACGGARLPLTAPTVSLAGQPARIGGAAAFFAGWAVVVLGLAVSLGVLLLFQSIWPASFVGWAVGLPMAIASLFFGLLLVFGGHRLRRSGVERRQRVQLDAVRALVEHQRGMITAADVSGALAVTDEEADLLLSELSKDANTEVNVEFDDAGRLRYLFGRPEQRWRVLEETAAREGIDAADLTPDDAAPSPRRVQR